ncbi:MAG: ParB/RepB/Spo0J family partition protein [Acidimicrobiia bacterium]|nr:ParB/RepB/Spo0J family partition protein [Acidimicrobiia bacterium]
MVRSRGMGRGLSALISDPAIQPQTKGQQLSSYLELPLDVISANPFQPRDSFDQVALQSLSESIREVGVLQPVLVRLVKEGKYQLIAGERRYRAARQAGLSSIPAVVRSAKDADALQQALLENLQREDLNPIEQALSFQRLIDEFDFTQEKVAKCLSRSRSSVANTLRLLQLPEQVKEMVTQGSLTAGHARALLGVTDPNKLVKLAEKTVAESLTVRMVEEAVKDIGVKAVNNVKAVRTRKADRGAAVLELENQLGDYLDTKVDVFLGKGQGKVVIQFADMGDLERIYRVMLQR